MADQFPARSSEAGLVKHQVRFTGAAAANPTKNYGSGIAATWVSTGLYELTWTDAPGTFVDFKWSLQATTAADLKGYTVVAGDYNATTKKLRVSVTNASDALADLTSTQKLGLQVYFKEVGA